MMEHFEKNPEKLKETITEQRKSYSTFLPWWQF